MNVLVPRFDSFTRPKLRAMEREFRFGEKLRDYVEAEKLKVGRMMRRTGLHWKDRTDPKQRRFGELELDGVIPSRVWFRWLQEDPDFWKDDGNWKRFKRDNPEVQPWRG